MAAPLVLVLLSACSPTLDWREVRPEGSGVVALFPCKPSSHSRTVTLSGDRVNMLLTTCRAGDTAWALAFADVADPARVTPALAALRAASAANLGGPQQVVGPMRVSGMTPNEQAERVRLQGKLPDGQPTALDTGVFAKGTRVYQATVMGSPGDEAAGTFFDSLKLPS